MHLEMSVSKILAHGHLWYFKTAKIFIKLTSNMIYIVAFGGGLKCPRKIYLNTQWGGRNCPPAPSPVPTGLKKFSSSALQHVLVLVLVQAIRIPSIKSGEETFSQF